MKKKPSQKTTYRNVKHQVQTTDSKQHLAQTHFNDTIKY